MEEAKTTETQEQKEQPKRNKLTSAKLWVTLWAIGMVSFIVIANRIDFMTIFSRFCEYCNISIDNVQGMI